MEIVVHRAYLAVSYRITELVADFGDLRCCLQSVGVDSSPSLEVSSLEALHF
jgi:hypothetical protein